MILSTLQVQPRYAESDPTGNVYYSRYFEYFESGRVDLLRTQLIPYSKLEKEYELFLPVIEAHARYVAAAQFDEQLTLQTRINTPVTKKICFDYRLLRGEKLLVEGYKGLCKVMCRKLNVPVSMVSMRIKDFESFYTKILQIANTYKPAIIANTVSQSANFRRWIERPTKDSARKLFEELRDIVGVRVVCVFEGDVEKLETEFKSLLAAKQLLFAPDDYKDLSKIPPGLYRSIHITVRIGEGRASIRKDMMRANDGVQGSAEFATGLAFGSLVIARRRRGKNM
jgi:acyl-CoA thioester hydrolase